MFFRYIRMKNTSLLTLKGTERLKTVIQKNRRRVHQHFLHDYSPVKLFPQPSHPHMQASVIIPVKNESENIVKTLNALRNQLDEKNNPLPFYLYEILLLANNCTDDTYAIAAAYQKKHPQLPLHIAEIRLEKKKAHIGTARRLLMDEAFRRHYYNKHDGIILSTDGDTEADVHWIINTLTEIKNGCDAVGGRILTKKIDCDCKQYYLQDTAYRCLSARLESMIDFTKIDMQSSHFQCFGASLAVRCSVYEKAGRLPVIPFLEDEAFSRALYRIDARVKKSPNVKVYTSSRLEGRVKAGLSVHLKHLGEMKKNNVPLYVESAQTLLLKYHIKRQLRLAWQLCKQKKAFANQTGKVASVISVSQKWLLTEMDVSIYFGEFWEKAEQQMYAGAWKKKQYAVPIEEAIRGLREYLSD